VLTIDKKLEAYIDDHIDMEDEILTELNRETNQKIYHPQRLTSHLQGRLIGMICKMLRPVRVLEIGTFTGYSSICIARSLPDNGLLYTIEMNDELEDLTRSFFEKAGLPARIRFLIGDALTIIPGINELFDLIYIDGNKKEYPDYYRICFDKLRHGGFIIADNVLWSGKIVQDAIESGDHFTKGIMTFNDMVKNDHRVEKVILPVGDGISIILKK